MISSLINGLMGPRYSERESEGYLTLHGLMDFLSIERKCHIYSPFVKFRTYLAVVISKNQREHHE